MFRVKKNSPWLFRLHNQIMDIGGSKMSAAQACVNTIQSQIDQVEGQITKATVGVKTSERYFKMVKIHQEMTSLELFSHWPCIIHDVWLTYSANSE